MSLLGFSLFARRKLAPVPILGYLAALWMDAVLELEAEERAAAAQAPVRGPHPLHPTLPTRSWRWPPSEDADAETCAATLPLLRPGTGRESSTPPPSVPGRPEVP